MKNEKKQPMELADIKKEVVNLDIYISAINRVITLPDRTASIFALKNKEAKLISEKKRLTIKAHQLENKLIDMGRGAAFGLYRIPQVKTNQYSN